MKTTKILPTFSFEQKLWQKGYKHVAGIDEVGMGAFAGPLVVAGVIFPKKYDNTHGFLDSKLLTPKKRLEQNEIIYKNAENFCIEVISVEHINKYGLAKAVMMGIQKVCDNLQPEFSLLDGMRTLNSNNQKAVIKGDQAIASISAASIIAKVYRDKLMEGVHSKYPHYNFYSNKGYGTKEHREAIKQFGFCKIHRTCFNLDPYLHE